MKVEDELVKYFYAVVVVPLWQVYLKSHGPLRPKNILQNLIEYRLFFFKNLTFSIG